MDDTASVANAMMGTVATVCAPVGFVGSVCSILGYVEDRVMKLRLRRRKKMK